jgi:hypothetical protein
LHLNQFNGEDKIIGWDTKVDKEADKDLLLSKTDREILDILSLDEDHNI